MFNRSRVIIWVRRNRIVLWVRRSHIWVRRNPIVFSVCCCLLVLAVVVAIALYRDPKEFSLSNWQTVIAALIALGAATLAYYAAMNKLQFDERTVKENERRKALGIFMRFEFAADVLKYEAENLLKKIGPPKSSSENSLVAVDDLALSEMPEITEAWENLDYFPVALSAEFYEVQNELYNFGEFKKDHAGKSFPSEYGMTEHEKIDELREILKDLQEDCANALELVSFEIERLREQVI